MHCCNQPREPDAWHPGFRTTEWSIVLAAGDQESPRAAEALERLCRAYWYPLYACVRRQGYSPEDAQDLTQEFFGRLLARRDLELVRRERGRFRSYLLAALKHFLINDWKRRQTHKRGGGRTFIPLDLALAEGRYLRDIVEEDTPELIFERRWATSLIEQVLVRLEQEYHESGRHRQFESLRVWLSDEPTRPQAEIAAELGMSENAVKQAVHRMRVRYRELLRGEIAQTVATTGDVETELRHLISVLRE